MWHHIELKETVNIKKIEYDKHTAYLTVLHSSPRKKRDYRKKLFLGISNYTGTMIECHFMPLAYF